MKIKYLGHACFMIFLENGVHVIFDPFETGHGLLYSPINEIADIVVISHDHRDHNYINGIKENPEIVKGNSKNIDGVEFRVISAYHDSAGGNQRGTVYLTTMKAEGLSLCHAGDLGHELNPEQISSIGHIDVLFIPVGGNYTVDAPTAWRIVNLIKPLIVFPMHYRNEKCEYPIKELDCFTKDNKDAKFFKQSEVTLLKKGLPQSTEVWIMPPFL